jgi:hypothetical protein
LQPAISQRKHNPKHHDRINSTKTTCGKANPKPDATIVLANDLAPGHSGGGDKPRRLCLVCFSRPHQGDGSEHESGRGGLIDFADERLPRSQFYSALGSPITVGLGPSSVATADFNLDGRLDLVAGNESSNNLSVLLGNGSGGFSPAPGSPVATGEDPIFIAIADFNLDGKPDVAVTTFGAQAVNIFWEMAPWLYVVAKSDIRRFNLGRDRG